MMTADLIGAVSWTMSTRTPWLSVSSLSGRRLLVPVEQGLPEEPGRVRQLPLARAVPSPEPIGSSRGERGS